MERKQVMIDNHVHVGWYTDGYHSPNSVWLAEIESGINEIVVSSTSTCAELYKLVVKEMRELIRIGGNSVHPLLWITPKMMRTWGIRYMLHSKIHWQGIKLHWGAHREWYYNKKLLYDTLNIARCKSWPVLLHTGESKECQPTAFIDTIKDFPDVKFILAHGRPIFQTVDVLKLCPNTYVDTAFMPSKDISFLIKKALIDRILFGTDTPINQIYDKDCSMTNYIKQCLQQLQKATTSDQYKKIIERNIYK